MLRRPERKFLAHPSVNHFFYEQILFKNIRCSLRLRSSFSLEELCPFRVLLNDVVDTINNKTANFIRFVIRIRRWVTMARQGKHMGGLRHGCYLFGAIPWTAIMCGFVRSVCFVQRGARLRRSRVSGVGRVRSVRCILGKRRIYLGTCSWRIWICFSMPFSAVVFIMMKSPFWKWRGRVGFRSRTFPKISWNLRR